jgi:hypothetical protein
LLTFFSLPSIFYQTMCAKFKISNRFKQSIDETHSKQTKKNQNSIPVDGF